MEVSILMFFNKFKQMIETLKSKYNKQNEKTTTNTDETMNFFDLMPVISLSEDEMKGYKEALDFAINDERIKNVAVTGSYGSGKSSIIESYKNIIENEGRNINFLHISLAHFDESEVSKIAKDNKLGEDSSSTEKMKVKLEGQILNQLLHQVDSKRIPQTIFRVKSPEKSRLFFLRITILIIISLLAILNFFEIKPIHEKIRVVYNMFPFPFLSSEIEVLINSVIVVATLGILIYYFVKLQTNKKIIKKFSLKNSSFETNIEIFNNSEDSYFDKYLDDVLYLFINSDADVIVFEDIDRFKGNSIFEKLKEINTLVNNKLKNSSLKKNKQIFLYLLKDDTFFSKDRTKFFDFLISVVPVMTGANAYEKILEYIEKAKLNPVKKSLDSGEVLKNDKSFDKTFLQKVTLYIDDLRLLKNIINEYQIYNANIDLVSNKLDMNNLLAMIIYKNIFPSDYSDLLMGRGFTYTVIQDKEVYINNRIKMLEENINHIQKSLEKSDEETINDLAELELLMIQKYGYNFSRSYIEPEDPPKQRLDKLKSSSYIGFNMNGRSSSELPETVFELIVNDKEYIQRKQAILDKNPVKVEELNKKIFELRVQIAKASVQPLKNVITREDILAKLEKYADMKNSQYIELLIYLITEGYISESYSDYMTYFYEKGLKSTDKIFLRSIVENNPLSRLHPLTKDDEVAEEVLDRISTEDYLKQAILNFDFFTLVIEKISNLQKLNNIFTLIDDDYEFYINYYQNIRDFEKKDWKNTDELIKSLINKTNMHLPNLIDTIYKEVNFKELLDVFAYDFLKYSTPKQIMEITKETQELQNYVKHSSRFLDQISNINTVFISKVLLLKIKFTHVDFSTIDRDLGELLLEKNLYEINKENIFSILTFYDKETLENINLKNLTLIQKSSKPNFKSYIQDNIEEYLLLISSSQHSDEENVIYDLLNNEKISDEILESYLKNNLTTTGFLSNINSIERQSLALDYGFAERNYLNIIEYFEKNNMVWNSTLTNFVNNNLNNFEKFDLNMKDALVESDLEEMFTKQTIYNNDLNDDIYRNILSILDYKESNFTIDYLSESKIDILLELNKILLNHETLATFRNYYPASLTKFIILNIHAYIEYLEIEDGEYTENEMLSVIYSLEFDEVSESTEIKLLSYISEAPILIKDVNFSDLGISLIIRDHIDEKEYAVLFREYSDFKKLAKQEIIRLAENMVTDKTIFDYKIEKSLVKDLLDKDTLGYQEKQELFSAFIELFDKKEIQDYLPSVGLSQLQTIFVNNKRPKVPANDSINKILFYLKKLKVVSSYSEKDDEFKVIPTKK